MPRFIGLAGFLGSARFIELNGLSWVVELSHTTVSFLATPTVGVAQGLASSLSAPLVPLPPILPVPYPPAHTFDTPASALLDEVLIEIHPIGQEHIGKGAPVLGEAVGLERDLFPEDEG